MTTKEMNEKERKAFEALPKPPANVTFTLVHVMTHVDPHPYCVTTGHVVEAAEHFGGMLSEKAIESAEKKGVRCDTCRRESNYSRTYREHESMLIALLAVPDNSTPALQTLPGLKDYLLSAKDAAEKAGVAGFGFVKSNAPN